jgi:hypothetical protein
VNVWIGLVEYKNRVEKRNFKALLQHFKIYMFIFLPSVFQYMIDITCICGILHYMQLIEFYNIKVLQAVTVNNDDK